MHSNSSPFLVLAVVFAIGAIMFTVGSVLVRRTREIEPETIAMLEPIDVTSRPLPWTAELAGNEEPVSLELRMDMIERLAMVGELWCVELLERARAHDADEQIRDAADNALLVIGARR